MRAAILLLVASALVGCAPIDSPRKSGPKPPVVLIESTVTKAAKAAFKVRDNVYAEQLDQLANDVDSGDIKFDAKLKQRLDDAKARAIDAANPALAKVISDEFGPNAMANPSKVSQSLRDLAKALK